MTPRRLVLLGLAALFVVYAWPMQVNGWNQNAHYALVRALADGVPYIDRTRHEIGDVGTGDVGTHDGHTYAAKPPGLAEWTLPAFLVVDLAGARTTGDPTRPIWWLHLWGAALPGVALVLCVVLVANRVEPGFGAATGAFLGLGTLVLPFSTMLFNHVLSTLFAFLSFALLWLERERGPDLRLVAAAGLAVGFAVSVDFQVGAIAAVLLVYALGAHRIRRGLTYLGASVAGALPLFAFNLWAFRNPFYTAYDAYHQVGVGEDFWSAYARAPSLSVIDDLLLSSMGLLVLMPVLAVASVGVVVLARESFRVEALVIGAISVILLAYYSSVGGFGGQGPPRYVTPLMPFLAVGIAPMLRRFPLTTLALGAISAFQLVVQASTGPLAAYDGAWLERARERLFVETAAAVVGITGWYAIAGYFVAVAAVVAFAAVATRQLEVRGAELPFALAATAAWALLAAAASNDYGRPPSDVYVLTVLVVVVAAAIAAAAATQLQRRAATT